MHSEGMSITGNRPTIYYSWITIIKLVHLATPTHTLQGHISRCTKRTYCNCLAPAFMHFRSQGKIKGSTIEIPTLWLANGTYNFSQCTFCCFLSDVWRRGEEGLTFHSPLIEKSSCWYSEWAEDGRTHGKSDNTIMLNPLFRTTSWTSQQNSATT